MVLHAEGGGHRVRGVSDSTARTTSYSASLLCVHSELKTRAPRGAASWPGLAGKSHAPEMARAPLACQPTPCGRGRVGRGQGEAAHGAPRFGLAQQEAVTNESPGTLSAARPFAKDSAPRLQPRGFSRSRRWSLPKAGVAAAGGGERAAVPRTMRPSHAQRSGPQPLGGASRGHPSPPDPWGTSSVWGALAVTFPWATRTKASRQEMMSAPASCSGASSEASSKRAAGPGGPAAAMGPRASGRRWSCQRSQPE